MAGLALPVRDHNGDESSIVVMIRAMAPTFIEQHEALMTQEGIDLGKTDIAGCSASYQSVSPTPRYGFEAGRILPFS